MCEHFLACCFPCCYVFSKRGCGSECCVNFLLGWLCYLPAVCHACTFIGTDRYGGGGDTKVVVQNTITNNVPQQQQPMMVQMAPAPGHYYGHGQQPMAIQTQPGASPAPYFAPQQPQIHQFQPEAPPMYSPAK